MAADANVGAMIVPMRAGVKYCVNLLNAKIETRNKVSNKIINPVLFGFDFANLKLLTNNNSLTATGFFGIFFKVFVFI